MDSSSIKLNTSAVCDAANLSLKIGKRKKRLKVTSTHNSILCRNTTLNSTLLKQTLKSNNRALAKRLELIRFELAETQKLLLKEKEEKQTLHQKYLELYNLVGLKDEEFEAEVERRLQLRTNDMKENLNSILGNMLSTVDLLQGCMTMVEPRLSRGSSLGLGGWGQDTDSPPGDTLPGAKRSIYYQGPSIQPAQCPVKSHDPVLREADVSDKPTEVQRDLLHQALDVILEQSGLSDSLMFPEEGGSRRNSKKSRPNSVAGSRRSSRRSSLYLGSLGRKSGETSKEQVTEDITDPTKGQGERDSKSPVALDDDRPIVSKYAPHIQGTTPATSPSHTSPVNQDEEHFYNRFIPLEEVSKPTGKCETPKSTKSDIPTAVGRKNKKNELQTNNRGPKEDPSKSKKTTTVVPEQVSALSGDSDKPQTGDDIGDHMTDSSLGGREEADDKAGDGELETECEKTKTRETDNREECTTAKVSNKKRKANKDILEVEMQDRSNIDTISEQGAGSNSSLKTVTEGCSTSKTDKRGTFVLKKAPAAVENNLPPKSETTTATTSGKTVKTGRSKNATATSKQESSMGVDNKRGTFVLDKPPVVGAEPRDIENDQVTRKTARRVRRGTFAVPKEDKEKGSAATVSKVGDGDNSKQSRLRRGTFCIRDEVALEEDDQGSLGEKDSLLMDTSIVSVGPGNNLAQNMAQDADDLDESDCVQGHDEDVAHNSESEKAGQKKTNYEVNDMDSEADVCMRFGDSAKPAVAKGDGGVFKVPFPVVSLGGRVCTDGPQSSGTDHTICEAEEMEMTEVLTTEEILCLSENKVPLPSFITRENSMEPMFLKDVSLENKDNEGNEGSEEKQCEGIKEDRKKSTKRDSTRVKKSKGQTAEKSDRAKAVNGKSDGAASKDRDKDQGTVDSEVEDKTPREDKPGKGPKTGPEGKEVEDDMLGTDMDEVVPKKKARHDSESDSSESGKVRKHFNTFVSKPGKIMFKTGRKDIAEIASTKGKKNNYKVKSILPRATLKTTTSKLKGKLLPSTSPLNTSRIGHTKNVFDLSLNESIPVPSSISYGQFLEQKTIKDQNKPAQTTDGGKAIGEGSIANETVTEHGIMLVLGNGKRTKPRRPRSSSKGVRYASELTEDHLITPVGNARVESRTGEPETNKNTVVSKKKEVEVKKNAGHTPPRKPLDSKQRKKLAEVITKHNQEATVSSCDEDDEEEASPQPAKGRRQSQLKVKKRRIISEEQTESDGSRDKSEDSDTVKPSVTEDRSCKGTARTTELNHSLFTAEDSTSEDQGTSPEHKPGSAKPSVKRLSVQLKRLNVTPVHSPSRDILKDNETTSDERRSGHRKGRKASTVEVQPAKISKASSKAPSDSSSPMDQVGRKKSVKEVVSSGKSEAGLKRDNRAREKERQESGRERQVHAGKKKQSIVSESSDNDEDEYVSSSNSNKRSKRKVKRVQRNDVVSESEENVIGDSGQCVGVVDKGVWRSLEYEEEENCKEVEEDRVVRREGGRTNKRMKRKKEDQVLDRVTDTEGEEEEFHRHKHVDKQRKGREIDKRRNDRKESERVTDTEGEEEELDRHKHVDKQRKGRGIDRRKNDKVSDTEEEETEEEFYRNQCKKKSVDKQSESSRGIERRKNDRKLAEPENRMVNTDEEEKDDEYRYQHTGKKKSVEKQKKSRGIDRRKNERKEGRVADSEGEEVRKRTKEKTKSKAAQGIPLPVDLGDIKDEVESFVEDLENRGDEDMKEESPSVGRRSRRAAGTVSYKEPNLHQKVRRGDSMSKTVYSGKDAPNIFKGKKEAKKSTGKRRSVVEKKRSALLAIGNLSEET